MTQINLRAGDITTEVRCDDATPEQLACITKQLQQWQMRQWTQVDGAAVKTQPDVFNI